MLDAVTFALHAVVLVLLCESQFEFWNKSLTLELVSLFKLLVFSF